MLIEAIIGAGLGIANFAIVGDRASQFVEIDPTPLWKTGE
jgi:hypothetical protein